MANKARRKKKTSSNRKLPFVAAATLCENVIESADSANSLIRMFDRFAVRGKAPKMPPGVFNAHLYISLRSGEALGERHVHLKHHSPSGAVVDMMSQHMRFAGGEQGNNINIKLHMLLNETGLHWFSVLVGTTEVTRIPLNVTYTRETSKSNTS